MSQFDLAFGFSEAAFNSLLKTIYQKPATREKLFKGQASGTVSGDSYQISWDIAKLPVLVIGAPPQAEWEKMIGPDGKPLEGHSLPDKILFRCDFPETDCQISISDEQFDPLENLSIYCSIEIPPNENALCITPLALDDTKTRLDELAKIIFHSLAVPKLFEVLRNAMAKIDLPSTTQNIFGVRIDFAYPQLVQNNKHLVLACCEASGILDLSGMDWPENQNTFILGKPEFVLKLVKEKINSLSEMSGSGSGEKKKLLYSYDYGLAAETLTAAASDPTKITAVLDVHLKVEASPGKACAISAAV